jgi:transcriptional regulator with XRE-family HTH domain
MKINSLTPEVEILKELGSRLARIRKQQGIAQTALAEEAGIGVATLRRIESGQDSQLASWVKLLKTLNMISSIENLLPQEFNSPMTESRGISRKRAKTVSSAGILWGDESA